MNNLLIWGAGDQGIVTLDCAQVIVASGDNHLRERKLSVLDSMGISIGTIIHPTAVISPRASISNGCTVPSLMTLK